MKEACLVSAAQSLLVVPVEDSSPSAPAAASVAGTNALVAGEDTLVAGEDIHR